MRRRRETTVSMCRVCVGRRVPIWCKSSDGRRTSGEGRGLRRRVRVRRAMVVGIVVGDEQDGWKVCCTLRLLQRGRVSDKLQDQEG